MNWRLPNKKRRGVSSKMQKSLIFFWGGRLNCLTLRKIILLKTVKGFCCLMQEIKNGIDRTHLISILHQTTTCSLRARLVSVVVSYFNSTSNHNPISKNWTNSIVVSYFNSTSNHNTQLPQGPTLGVVSYFNSTSNHNWDKSLANLRLVVSYFNSTSNHNLGYAIC